MLFCCFWFNLMQEYLEREYLMFNFSFYRFAFHTIKPPKTCPVRKKQFNILVQLHRKSNNIIRNRPWTDTTLDCKTGRLHWIAKTGAPFHQNLPHFRALKLALHFMCSDCQFNCLCSLSICNKMKAHKII